MNFFSWIDPARLHRRRAMSEDDVTVAHRRSSNHRREVEASERCGCFCCLGIFSPQAIQDWVDEESTAICPGCGVDSVIGSASGFPIAREFLERMRRRWFPDGGDSGAHE
jgi:hypothetical protein